MATAYEISFKYEILNEFIASIDGFITRNYLYSGKEMPSDIKALESEVWDIYDKLPLENNIDKLNGYNKRLSEIRGYVHEHTPIPQECKTTDYSEYSEGDFQKAFDYYYKALTSNKTPSDNPQACVLGGQSGSGKSTVHKIVSERNPNVIVIDGDRFREQHPNFEIIQKLYGNDAANYTQKFSNGIVNAMIEKLSSERYNLIIEGTCRTAEVPLKTCRELKAKGYQTELAVMCTDKDISWQSTIDRYNEMQRLGLFPRAVPKEKYLDTVAAISKNISVIYNSREFDEITLYNREKQCLYKFSETPQTNPASIVDKMLNEIEHKKNALSESDEKPFEKPF